MGDTPVNLEAAPLAIRLDAADVRPECLVGGKSPAITATPTADLSRGRRYTLIGAGDPIAVAVGCEPAEDKNALRHIALNAVGRRPA